MVNIVTRQSSLRPLTHAQVDANFTALNAAIVAVQQTVAANANASAITFAPVGGVTSKNVQAAIAELDTKKAPKDSPTFTGSALFATLRAAGDVYLGGSTAGESLRIPALPGTVVNRVQISGSGSAGRPLISQEGEAGIGLRFGCGASDFSFLTGGSALEQFRVGHYPNAVNYFRTYGAATGGAPTLETVGVDINVNASYNTKGSGAHVFSAGGRGQFLVEGTANAANYMATGGAVAGASPYTVARGADTNIGMYFGTKGTSAQFVFADGAGASQLRIGGSAGAVNYAQIRGGSTGQNVGFDAVGADTNVGFDFNGKGTGTHVFRSNGGIQFQVGNTVNSVNYLAAIGGAAGSGLVTLGPFGSDVNIDVLLGTKGTGVMRFGTFTSNGDAAVNGYVTIKDAAGNLRKLATIA